jgi:hypothetical protein
MGIVLVASAQAVAEFESLRAFEAVRTIALG